MNTYLRDSLKTKNDHKLHHMLVFTTDKTLHERFSFKHQPCVFILNNGYTSSFKNNDVKGRIVFPYKNMHSLFEKGISEENKIKAKEQLEHLARQRRTVFMPTKLGNETDMECISEETLPLSVWSKSFDSSTPKPDHNIGNNFIARRLGGWNTRPNQAIVVSPLYLPGRYRYRNQFPYKWRRRRLSKAQLDDEIDEYMAEVRSKITMFSKDNNVI